MPPLRLSPLFAAVVSAALMLSVGLASSSAEPIDVVGYSPLSPSAATRGPVVDMGPSLGTVPGDHYAAFVAEASLRFDVPESWIKAVMGTESAGDPSATSPKGAMGLMQVMPQTWADLRARYGFGPNAYDARDSILAGAAYLREMHDRYGTIEGMLAAYNAGPGRYDDHLATGRPLPGETVNYVSTIAPLIGGMALPLPASRRIVRALDPVAAPLFVPRAGDRQQLPVQTGAVPTAAFTPNEVRAIAAQNGAPGLPGVASGSQTAAGSPAARAWRERRASAGDLQPSPETRGLFVPRSQP